MRRIAIYGKGGIGKSTISSNLTAALSDKGIKVLQIGCDPKHDSTRLLLGGTINRTVLEYIKDKVSNRDINDIVYGGYKGCLCVEAGGPEPGIGCAGRGIISAFEVLQELGIDSIPIDLTIYDVLGDVVCGGFAVPLRDGYADTVYIVTSGEFMSIYAANNILKGTANYNPNRIGGIIFNSRGDNEEFERVKRFSDAVAVPIVASFDRSKEFLNAERSGKTVVELNESPKLVNEFYRLAEIVLKENRYEANYLDEYELEQIVLGRTNKRKEKPTTVVAGPKAKKKVYISRNVQKNEVRHGCAFSGASATAMSISNLTTIMHSPRNCAHFAYQLAPSSVKRSYFCEGSAIHGFTKPSVICTDMTESSMIFGGIDDLKNSIHTALSRGDKNIAVITSCPSGIIGDDVENIIKKEASEFPDATIVPLIEDGNLNGDFMQGIIDASIGITKAFVSNKEKTDSVNLVGIKILATTCVGDIEYIDDIFSRLDIQINCRYLGNTDIEDVKNLTAAKVCLLMNPDRFSMMLKDFLQDTYGLKFTQNIIRPGLKPTIRWIEEISEIFNKKEIADEIIASLKIQYDEYAQHLREYLKNKTIYILSMNRDIDWILEMTDAVGMKIERAVVIDQPDYTMDYDVLAEYPFVEVMENREINKIISDINEKSPDILISPYPIEVDVRIQRHIPLVPDIGPFGALELAQSWINYMKAPEEGWRKDGRI